MHQDDWLRVIRIVRGKETYIVTDERTEKVAGKTAIRTIVVIMVAIAIILFGNVLNLCDRNKTCAQHSLF